MLLIPLYTSKAAALKASREPKSRALNVALNMPAKALRYSVNRRAREGVKGSRLNGIIRGNGQAKLLPKVPAKARANGPPKLFPKVPRITANS